MSMTEKEKVQLLVDLLKEVTDKTVSEQADFLYKKGIEPRISARWIKDKNYKGKVKEIFFCSYCLHWQTIKKLDSNSVHYMKYCPFCGAKMEV